jgi:hypothetical protein
MLKKSIKKILGYTNSKLEYPVVVASCGRSCSTLLTHAIAKSATKVNIKIGNYVAQHGIVMYVWNVRNVNPQKGLVYKTHDYPPSKDFAKTKFIYTYSDPYKIIASLHRKQKELGKEWIRDHAKRLKNEVEKVEESYRKDAFGLEDNFNSWRKKENLDLLLIRANCIWEKKEKIQNHIGMKINLPEKRKRKSDIKNIPTGKEIEKIKETYRNMHKLVINNKLIDKRKRN